MAFVVSAMSVTLLLAGIKESKRVSNVFTFLKLLLVVFMVVGGFYFFNTENLHPSSPYGIAGVLRGTTSSFSDTLDSTKSAA